jgi:tetratricopeptide (TPR) repeat protein
MITAKRNSCILGVALAGLLVAAASPESWIRRGNEAFARGDYQTALDYYDRAAAETLDPGQVAFDQAAAYYRLGDFASAEWAYRRSLEDADGIRRVRALYGLANALAQQGQGRQGRFAVGQLREAVRQYEACLREAGALVFDEPQTVSEICEHARYNLSLVKPLLEHLLADPARNDNSSQPESVEPPSDDPRYPKGSRDPNSQHTGSEGARPGGNRDRSEGDAQVGPDGQPWESNQHQAGKGNLPPLPDNANGPPLQPDQALDYLQQNLDRIRRDRANREKPPTADVKGQRDW